MDWSNLRAPNINVQLKYFINFDSGLRRTKYLVCLYWTHQDCRLAWSWLLQCAGLLSPWGTSPPAGPSRRWRAARSRHHTPASPLPCWGWWTSQTSCQTWWLYSSPESHYNCFISRQALQLMPSNSARMIGITEFQNVNISDLFVGSSFDFDFDFDWHS